MHWASAGPDPTSGWQEFVNIGSGPQDWSLTSVFGSNGAAINIPIGWVPHLTLQYGGFAALTQVNIFLDKFGGAPYEAQLIYLLNVLPLVGIALGYGFGAGGYGKDHKGDAGCYKAFQEKLHDIFSMQNK